MTGVLFQALRDHVTSSASDARVKRNGMQHPFDDLTYAFCSSQGKMKVVNIRISGVFCFISITM
jgi:hypothetical protein